MLQDVCGWKRSTSLQLTLALKKNGQITRGGTYIHHAGNDLRDVGDRLDPERVEDEGDGFDDLGVVTGQRRVSDDLHERRDRHGRVEVVQVSVAADVDEHFTRAHLVALLHLGRAVADGDQRRRLDTGGVDLQQEIRGHGKISHKSCRPKAFSTSIKTSAF